MLCCGIVMDFTNLLLPGENRVGAAIAGLSGGVGRFDCLGVENT